MHEAAASTANAESLRDLAAALERALQEFGDRLETVRERVEGASRLHHLLGRQSRDEDDLREVQRLSEKLGKPELFQNLKPIRESFVMGGTQSTPLKVDVKHGENWDEMTADTR